MNRWDTRYNSDAFVYGKAPNDFLKENRHHLPKGKILCLAEGEGRNAVYLAGSGYDVTAVDASRVGLDKAEKLAQESGLSIETVVADLAEYPIESKSWDGIVSIFCHVPEAVRKSLHAKVCSGLKQGGILLLEAYRPEQLALGTGGPPEASMMMTLELLRDELPDLKWVHAEELERDVLEGSLHTGRGAVVQVIGRKR